MMLYEECDVWVWWLLKDETAWSEGVINEAENGGKARSANIPQFHLNAYSHVTILQ
jgi:hypothetical protein